MQAVRHTAARHRLPIEGLRMGRFPGSLRRGQDALIGQTRHREHAVELARNSAIRRIDSKTGKRSTRDCRL